jgi:hypothetical protein
MGRKDDVEEEREPSRAVGGCVLVALGGGAIAAVFAASEAAGILAVWLVGAAAIWRCARRRIGTYLPLPSPTVTPSRGDVYARETGRAARVVEGPGGITIIHPEIEHVTEPDLPGEVNER